MKKVKLEEVSEIYGGYAFKSKDFGVGENFVVKIKDIKPPIIDIENADKVDVTKYSIKKMEKYKVFPDDIVIAMTGATIGKVGRNKSGRILYLNQRVAKINPNIKEDLDFIYYCISNNIFLEYVLNNLDSNSAQGNISHFGIGNFEINWYDRETRQKIAQILSCLDDKIEILHQINDNLAELAKTIYDYWFVQFDFPDENGKPYKSSGGKMVYNNVLKREIPEGWEVDNIFNVASIQYGFPFSTEFFNENKIGVPVIRIRDIKDNQISNFSTEEKIDSKYIIKKGEILIGMDGNFHINYWANDNCYLNQRVVKIQGIELSNIYLKEQIEPYIKTREKSISRTTVGHLSDKDLRSINIIIPNNLIMIKINSFYNNTLNKFIENLQQIQHLQSLRDWLLPMLMNGQVSVE